MLASAREARGLLTGPLLIYAAEDSESPADASGEDTLWVPHIYCWQPDGAPAIAWELQTEDAVRRTLDADPAAVRRWARCPQQLLRLAGLAANETTDAVSHLSMRWVLANETSVASALSIERVTLEHVSIHVGADEEPRVVALLVNGLGLIETARPASIETPGRWLQAGPVRIHLNSREMRSEEIGFPGTAPNHICFSVAELDAAVAAVEKAGFATVRAGSLGGQAWFRLSSGTTIELQQRR